MELDFETVVYTAHQFAMGEGKKRISDSEVMALHCAWDAISYDDFISKQLEYQEKYTHLYKNPGKTRSRSTLPAASCKVMRLFERNLDLSDLNQGNLHRKLSQLYEKNDSKLYKIINEFSSNNHNRNSITEVINSSFLSKNIKNEIHNYKQEKDLFVGRETDLSNIIGLLEKRPIVILRGFHGVGKTALLDHLSNLLSETFTYYYTDFGYISTFENWLVSLLSLSNENDYKPELTQLINDVFHFLESSNNLIILDSVGILGKEFLSFLESFALNKLSSRIVIASSFPINLNLPRRYCCEYEIKGLSKKNDIELFFDSLGLKDSEWWIELSNQYSGNFRELIYVSKFIKSIYGGRVSHYFDIGSKVISPDLKDYFSSIDFSELDREIFSICLDNKAILSSSLMEFLRKQKSSSEIFHRITHLANHGLLETSLIEDSEVICYSVSPLLESYLLQERNTNA